MPSEKVKSKKVSKSSLEGKVSKLSSKKKADNSLSETKRLAEQIAAKYKKQQQEQEKNKKIEEEDKDSASETEDKESDDKKQEEKKKEITNFRDLGVIAPLQEACDALGFKKPTPIQIEAIPPALAGRDIIGLAETGSGKTAAFALPILQALWNAPSPFFACVLAPTRELAIQISDQFEALGSGIGLRCAVIVGGMDMIQQSIMLARKPHIVVATPGRLVDHLENTKGFSLKNLKYLVMDEADRLLEAEFQTVMGRLLTAIPKQNRHTYLFSATMSDQVDRLKRASLQNPVRAAVSKANGTVKTLLQYYMFIPLMHRDTYLVYLLQEFDGKSIIIFTKTVADSERVALALRHLGFKSVPLHGRMNQTARIGALNKYKSGSRNIMVATDVASRGLDIPSVDLVINYDLPDDSKSYTHRVGRTARAGRSGKAISLVTQYNLDVFQRLEAHFNKKLPEFKVSKEEVMVLAERVGEALREASLTLREMEEKRSRHGKKKRDNDRNFEEE